jgi:hypothetical protein
VQGRITDGTLFPNISIAISKNMDELAQKTFRGLHDKVDAVLELIKDDLDMALASRQYIGDDENRADEEEERLREEFEGEAKELKRRYEELLAILRYY